MGARRQLTLLLFCENIDCDILAITVCVYVLVTCEYVARCAYKNRRLGRKKVLNEVIRLLLVRRLCCSCKILARLHLAQSTLTAVIVLSPRF